MIRDDADADTDRDPIDLVAEEFADRCRRGEQPSVNDYAARHPEHAAALREILPSVLMMEGLKRQRQRLSGGSGLSKRLETLGDFRIIREIGQGGMGIVYEAEQVSLGRRVALKVLPRYSHLDPSRLQRFQREAQAAGRLHHAHIVPVLGVGEHDGLNYYVMQYISGRGLDKLVTEWREQPDPPDEETRWPAIARMGREAATALQHAHEQGILHRDVKPANLLLDTLGVVWVTDFGLAKLLDRDNLTHTGDLIGTLQYMAPEQFQGRSDGRTDVYSLGLTLYELLTLTAGFQDSNPSQLIQRVSASDPPRPRKVNPAIPLDLETVVLKAIARDPAHRYQTARDLADDLGRFLEDRPVQARRVTVVERLWRWSRRNRTVAALWALALASLLLTAVSGWVGYARTTTALRKETKLRDLAEKATRRADDNVALSLAAIEDLFNKLAARESEAQPGDDEFDPMGDPGMPPPGEDDGFGPRRGPPRRPGRARQPVHVARDEAALLQGIVSFYDKFAEKNDTNIRLQREAARAYRRVGDLHQRLGQSDQAAAAYERCLAHFEALIARDPQDAAGQFELAESYVTMGKSEEATPDPAVREKQLRRALQLLKALDGASPDEPGTLGLTARAHEQLGSLLEETDQLKDAETQFRQVLALEEAIARIDPPPDLFHVESFDARRALADFLERHDRRPEGRALLLKCVDEFHAIRRNRPLPPAHHRSLERLVESLRVLEETELANEIEDGAALGPEPGRGGPPLCPGRRRPPPPPFGPRP